MTVIVAAARAAFISGILVLLIGVVNVQKTAIFVVFILAFMVFRTAEIASPYAHALKATVHGEDQSRLTTWILSFGFITNLVVPILQYRYALPLAPIFWLNWVGLLAFVAGSALRLWSMKTAGNAFNAQIFVTEKQRLATAGPYAWVRHPSYLGLIIAYAGIAGVFSSAWGLALLLIIIIPTLVVRLLKEEKMLATHFGDEWRDYTSKTSSMLVPGL